MPNNEANPNSRPYTSIRHPPLTAPRISRSHRPIHVSHVAPSGDRENPPAKPNTRPSASGHSTAATYDGWTRIEPPPAFAGNWVVGNRTPSVATRQIAAYGRATFIP